MEGPFMQLPSKTTSISMLNAPFKWMHQSSAIFSSMRWNSGTRVYSSCCTHTHTLSLSLSLCASSLLPCNSYLTYYETSPVGGDAVWCLALLCWTFIYWPSYQGKDILFRFIRENSSLRDFGPQVIIIGLFLYENFWKMIFWLVLELEISYRVL